MAGIIICCNEGVTTDCKISATWAAIEIAEARSEQCYGWDIFGKNCVPNWSPIDNTRSICPPPSRCIDGSHVDRSISYSKRKKNKFGNVFFFVRYDLWIDRDFKSVIKIRVEKLLGCLTGDDTTETTELEELEPCITKKKKKKCMRSDCNSMSRSDSNGMSRSNCNSMPRTDCNSMLISKPKLDFPIHEQWYCNSIL